MWRINPRGQLAMPSKIIGTSIAATAVSLLLLGCGAEEDPDRQQPAAEQSAAPESAPAPAPEAMNQVVEQMDPDGKRMHLTATSPTGRKFQASIGDEVEIPAEFPSDVPIFPGATPMASMSAPDEGIIVTFKSGNAQQEIFDYYESELPKSGWSLQTDENAGSQLSLDAIKEGRKVSVIVAGTEGDARVSVIVTNEI